MKKNAFLKKFFLAALFAAGIFLAAGPVSADGASFSEASNTVFAPRSAKLDLFTDKNTGRFALRIDFSDKANKVQSVRAGVWQKDSAADIYWYEAVKETDQSFLVANGDISNNGWMPGTYRIMVCCVLENNAECIVGETLLDFGSTCGEVKSEDIYGNIPFREETEYELSIDDVFVPGGEKTVSFAVWNEADRSLVRWYEAKQGKNTLLGTAKYTVTVPVSDFKQGGQYKTHVYAVTKSGARSFLKSEEVMYVGSEPLIRNEYISLKKSEGDAGKYTVRIEDITSISGVEKAEVCVFPVADPLCAVWYEADGKRDGSYEAEIELSKNLYELGDYGLLVYITMGNEVKCLTGGRLFTFNPSDFIYITRPEDGERMIVLNNPEGSDIKFRVWNAEAGKAETEHVYEGSRKGNTVTALVDLNKYHRAAGKYEVRAFSGENEIAKAVFTADKKEILKNGWYYEDFEGETYKFYYIDDVRQTDVRDIIGSGHTYTIEVNRTCNTITVFTTDGDNGYILPVCSFACSVGLPGTPTPTGVFYTGAKYRWKGLMGPSYGQYVTHVCYSVYIHSVAGYNMTSYNLKAAEYNCLGQAASHGCIRLNVRDAKWIYDNCQSGMRVYIYDSSNPGPMGKPDTIKIPDGQNWDPTDPNI